MGHCFERMAVPSEPWLDLHLLLQPAPGILTPAVTPKQFTSGAHPRDYIDNVSQMRRDAHGGGMLPAASQLSLGQQEWVASWE